MSQVLVSFSDPCYIVTLWYVNKTFSSTLTFHNLKLSSLKIRYDMSNYSIIQEKNILKLISHELYCTKGTNQQNQYGSFNCKDIEEIILAYLSGHHTLLKVLIATYNCTHRHSCSYSHNISWSSSMILHLQFLQDINYAKGHMPSSPKLSPQDNSHKLLTVTKSCRSHALTLWWQHPNPLLLQWWSWYAPMSQSNALGSVLYGNVIHLAF